MRIVTRIIAISRATRLGRELREIDGIIQALSLDARQKLALFTLRELAQAGRCEFPHLYGTPPEKRYAIWGSGADTGLARARSDNPQVRLRGIALWLAVVFHETRDSEHAQIAAIHRQILRVLRQLKESVPENTTNASNAWADTAEAAA
ncbi:MAG TPA: hypothetical protein VFL78_04975 [Rhodanobacteraceae bacterium]|nr:hypothetical protein [Rhodanobacteraceae bacterium]